jgi:hypothetical protein
MAAFKSALLEVADVTGDPTSAVTAPA